MYIGHSVQCVTAFHHHLTFFQIFSQAFWEIRLLSSIKIRNTLNMKRIWKKNYKFHVERSTYIFRFFIHDEMLLLCNFFLFNFLLILANFQSFSWCFASIFIVFVCFYTITSALISLIPFKDNVYFIFTYFSSANWENWFFSYTPWSLFLFLSICIHFQNIV